MEALRVPIMFKLEKMFGDRSYSSKIESISYDDMIYIIMILLSEDSITTQCNEISEFLENA